ncbi:MAG: isoprenyl transferase [Lachnospiraceae bacterium]|nr:isoprenyl transferase [Lachnospiraceae bacterium]
MAKKEEKNTIPKHIAIIMDGNGRWAKKRLLPRAMGHSAGANNVEKICEDAWDLGIKYLTVYAFSTENWTRSVDEVSALMKILKQYLEDCIEKSRKNNMRVRVIGDISRLSQDMQDAIRRLEDASKDFDGLQFQVALNYGGRDDIVRAVKGIALDAQKGNIDPEKIDENFISSRLDTSDIPDPDLLIRTSGELRISNFMLWQMAYTEMYFTDVYWPDFDKKELEKAIEYYGGRDRRYGGRKS